MRKTTDWANERTFLAQVPAAFKPKVEVWNETFDMPYHAFRHRLRQIAALNLSRVEGAVCTAWDDVPEGALVLPVDDDDWFSPDVARALERNGAAGMDGYYWVSSFIEVPVDLSHRLGLLRRRLAPGRPPRYVCTTNNYALVKRPAARRRFDSHVHASEWFAGAGAGRVIKIDGRLSAMNRTLASRTSLGFGRSSISRSYLLRKLRRYRRLYAKARPPELAWCDPYLTMMADLVRDLGIKGRRR